MVKIEAYLRPAALEQVQEALAGIGIAGPGHGDQAVDEIDRRVRQGQRRPAELAGRNRQAVEGCPTYQAIVSLVEGLVNDRRRMR